MVRHTKPLSGGGKDKFLRGLVDGVENVPESARGALKRELTEGILEVRVRRAAYDRVRAATPRQADEPPAAPSPKLPPAPAPAVTETVAPPSKPVFDPFAFSVVAVLTRKGRDALLETLAAIEAVEDLRSLALAQHLALDPDLASADEIRAAIVAGAERRIAERKAAAS